MKKRTPRIYPFYLGKDKYAMECALCPLRPDCFSDKLFSKDPHGYTKRAVKRYRYWGKSRFRIRFALLRISIATSVLSGKIKPCFKPSVAVQAHRTK